MLQLQEQIGFADILASQRVSWLLYIFLPEENAFLGAQRSVAPESFWEALGWTAVAVIAFSRVSLLPSWMQLEVGKLCKLLTHGIMLPAVLAEVPNSQDAQDKNSV